jgi:hypothetical protein
MSVKLGALQNVRVLHKSQWDVMPLQGHHVVDGSEGFGPLWDTACEESANFKGIVSKDFSSPVFSSIKFSWSKYVATSGNNFEFFRIFVEFSVFVIDCPVMNTARSHEYG